MKQTSYRAVDQIFPACMPVLRMAQVKKRERNRKFREHSEISCKCALAIWFAGTTLQRLSLAKCGGSPPSMMNYDLEVQDKKTLPFSKLLSVMVVVTATERKLEQNPREAVRKAVEPIA